MCCEAADALPPSRLGYYELRRFILNHNIVEGKIPPKIIPIRNKNFTDAIKVDLALYPVEIMSLDATEQVMSVTSYLVVMWEDPQLTWNPEDHDNVEMVELKASDIWLPTLSIVNMVGKKEILQDHKDGSVNLYSDGHVILSTSVQLMTACKMDLMYFPFDEQDCDIIFYTLSETPVAIHQLDVPLETSLQQYGAGGEWTLTNVKWTPLYDIFNVRYTSSVRGQFTLTLKRKTTFYTATIIGPMILFTVMNCLVFIIPLESGEKISFLISIFISNTVFSSYVNGIMPRGLGAKVPA
nr:hypothetical protein BaRGS_029280 [Batillaria attramentaria]